MPDPGKIAYEALSASSEQIRTLTLHAGGVFEPIACSLHVVSLGGEPEYDALSYTWGDPGVTRLICVDGVGVDVTENLEDALRHIRHAKDDITLWVDAICINQADNAEKSIQVAMMGRIYRRCSQVRIWLGCATASCALLTKNSSASGVLVEQKDPFELIRRLASGQHMHEWSCFEKSDEGEILAYRKDNDFEELWQGLEKISRCAWWSRMWTVQEIILPKHGTVVYDIWRLPLHDVTNSGDVYYQHVWGCCREASLRLPMVISTALDQHCSTFYTIHCNRNELLNDEEYFDVQEQHLSYGHRQCHNSRDKVYGLLGLIGDVSDLDIWLTPDYSSSVEEVFYNATCAMLYRGYPDLRCLTGEEYGPSPRKWTSWVRDFGSTLDQLDADTGTNRLLIYELFNASGAKKSRYEYYTTWPCLADERPHQTALGLSGRCVGTISSIYQEAGNTGPPQDDGLQRNKATFSAWLHAANFDFDAFASGQQSKWNEQIWRTLLGGAMSVGVQSIENIDWRRFDSEGLSWLEHFLPWLDDPRLDLPLPLDRTLLVATRNRYYFRTQKSLQGLCYQNFAVGDQVWVIDGSKVPFVLRHVQLPMDDEESVLRPIRSYHLEDDGSYAVNDDLEPREQPAGHYELLGDCYLDSFMDGEGLDEVKFPTQLILLV